MRLVFFHYWVGRLSGLFDSEWYFANNADVHSSGVDPLRHYIVNGAAEGRWPNATFNIRRYCRLFPKVSPHTALTHYALHKHWNRHIKYFSTEQFSPFDLYERLQRSEYWNSENYLACNPDVRVSGADPIEHYIQHGFREKRPTGGNEIAVRKIFELDPQACGESEVDPQWYFSEYPSLKSFGLSAEEHYLLIGRHEGRHPRFDADWYLSEYADVAMLNVDPRSHYEAIGRQQARHPAFHAEWYLQIYPDVAESGIDPLEHYRKLGRREGRHPAFHWSWYIDEYRDVFDAGLDPYDHFRHNGRGEGRHPSFHREWYSDEYGDVRPSGIDPYEHYRRYGRAQNRRPADGPFTLTTYRERLTFPFRQYESRYESRQSFAGKATDIKAIAFYLPQFHRCAENDAWWGEGFTEWTNARSAQPRFDGHYQPREPHPDIGYYDLSDPQTLYRQAKLAREHGIYGFCFYHYWFSGRRVLEKPLDLLIANPEIDINFCVCWANENWTRTWDGQDSEVLLEQKYTLADQRNFIVDVEKYVEDKRYIRVNGRPVIIVYKANIIKNLDDFISTWRLYWQEKHGSELEIWCVQADPSDRQCAALAPYIDGVVEFPPHVVPFDPHVMPYMVRNTETFGNITGHIFDYRRVVDDVINCSEKNQIPSVPYYRGVMLGWDNSARRKDGWTIWYGYSNVLYYKWLRHVISSARHKLPISHRFVFINAWNEWAEGTYLEPDCRSGYNALNTTSRALFNMEDERPVRVIDKLSSSGINSNVAVHLHIYFIDQLEELFGYISNIMFKFDLFITTDLNSKKQIIEERVKRLLFVSNVEIIVTENRGRDIGPFLVCLGSRLASYDFVGHFHSKKSESVSWGDLWRKYLLEHLLGSPEGINSLFAAFERNPQLGLVFPPLYPLLPDDGGWANMRSECESLMRRLGCDVFMPENPTFPAGNMFWARTEAIAPALAFGWTFADFPTESGQLEHTPGHFIERIWNYISCSRGFDADQILLEGPKGISRSSQDARLRLSEDARPRRLTLFVHFDPSDQVSAADMHLVRALKEVSTQLFVVSNSALTPETNQRLRIYADDVIVRPNKGLDFAAWRDAIIHLGWHYLRSFDEVLFVNNSCYGPLFAFETLFATMAQRPVDFWGITSFPEMANSDRPETAALADGLIPYHIQSYFLVFRRSVLQSGAFYNFWNNVDEKTSFVDVVASYEVQLTRKLVDAGFTCESYIPEAEIIQQMGAENPRYNAPYNDPYKMWLLGAPLIKKRAWQYGPAEMSKVLRAVGDHGYFPPHLLAN